MNACEIESHHYYFPRLLFPGRRRNRLLPFEEVEGSILLYSLRQRASRLEPCSYVPPFPLTDAARTQGRRGMRDFNRGRAGRIEWVQQEDAALVGTMACRSARVRRSSSMIAPRWRHWKDRALRGHGEILRP